MNQQCTSQQGPGPLVTVIMCTYNGQQFLDTQVESILNQSYRHLELVVCDDGSTDETLSLVRSWMAKDQRVQLLRNPENLGYNRNFEQALAKGTGTLIAISDQDDVWHPEKLARLVPLFDDDKVVLAHSGVASLRNDKISYKAARKKNLFNGSDPRPLFLYNHIAGHAMVLRRSLVDRVLPIPKGMYYDWWIAVTAACNGRVAAVNECLVYHRLHDHNSFFNSGAKYKMAADDQMEALNLFTRIKGLQPAHGAFIQQMQALFVQHRQQSPRFNWNAFRFFWQYRHIFFGYKKRGMPVLTHFKYSLLYGMHKLNANAATALATTGDPTFNSLPADSSSLSS